MNQESSARSPQESLDEPPVQTSDASTSAPLMAVPDVVAPGAPEPSSGSAARDLGPLMDIPVRLSMEIGRTQISVEKLLQLGKGTVVELERGPDEPLDVFVNGKLVARGEAVVVGERFGIRITEILSPRDRLEKAA